MHLYTRLLLLNKSCIYFFFHYLTYDRGCQWILEWFLPESCQVLHGIFCIFLRDNLSSIKSCFETPCICQLYTNFCVPKIYLRYIYIYATLRLKQIIQTDTSQLKRWTKVRDSSRGKSKTFKFKAVTGQWPSYGITKWE